MIYSNIHLPRPKSLYPAAILKVLDYIAETDFSNMELGRHSLDGDRIFIIRSNSETSPTDQRKAETHRKYIDIQFMLEGIEDIGVACVSDGLTMSEDLLDEKDIAFYSNVPNESFITLHSGDFAVLFPEDVHRPLCQTNGCKTVKKVIGKVLVDLI